MFVYLIVDICTVTSPAVLSTFAGCTSFLKQFADEEEISTHSESLMLEVDFETLIDNAESGVDQYMVFKDTMSG